MYYLLTKRASKLMSTNRYTLSGPFRRPASAEKAAIAALSTYSCVEARVLTEQQVRAIGDAHPYNCPDYDLRETINHAVRFLLPPREAEVIAT